MPGEGEALHGVGRVERSETRTFGPSREGKPMAGFSASLNPPYEPVNLSIFSIPDLSQIKEFSGLKDAYEQSYRAGASAGNTVFANDGRNSRMPLRPTCSLRSLRCGGRRRPLKGKIQHLFGIMNC